METGAVTTVTSSIRTLDELQSTSSSNRLERDDFLKILVAQLSHQDPMEPTSDTEFIAQLAQFSMLEEMQSINNGFLTSQAYSLIGKTVYVDDGTEIICGKVDGVVRKDGLDYLLIGEDIYEVSAVTGVLDESSTSIDQSILQSADLIGKTVTANFTDGEGEPVTVTGQVEKIMIQDGAIFAVVDGQNIPISTIQEIAA